MIIVAIMKNEQLFLQEWLDHHIELGIKKFILFNHDKSGYHISVPSGVEMRIINYSMYHGSRAQLRAYNEVGKYLAGETAAFIDIDEFICINPVFQKKLEKSNKATPLIDAAFEYFGVDALALSWMNISADGRSKRPYGGIRENYLKLCPKVRAHHNFKSIYRANQNIAWLSHHRATEGINLHDTDKNIVRGFTTNDLYDKIYIKHYITKSWEDYVMKLKRGNFTKGVRTVDTFFKYNPDMLHLKAKLTSGLNISEFPTI